MQALPYQPTFTSSRQRYEELTRETREAEVLAAQFRKMGVDSDEQDKIAAGNRRKYPAFAQTPTSNNMPTSFQNQQPQFGDFVPYSQQAAPRVPQGQNTWGGGEDSGYTADAYGNDVGFAERYGGHQNTYESQVGMVPAAEARNRAQHSLYFANGATQASGIEVQQPLRSTATVWPPPSSIPI